MLSATFDDREGGANDPAFSVDLTSFTAIFCRTEILQIIRGNYYTSQGDPDSIMAVPKSIHFLDYLNFGVLFDFFLW